MDIKSFLNTKLTSLLNGILNLQKNIDLKILPSQGLFYKDDFSIKIKRVQIEDIIEYEFNFNKEDLSSVILRVKSLVEKNTILPTNYRFEDIKSIDIIFLFLKIVSFSKKSEISITYHDEDLESESTIDFSEKNFNYFNISDEMMKYYDKDNKYFLLNGYKFSLPTIGVENCLTKYLILKSINSDINKYNNYSYDFNYFLSDRKFVSNDEIENLIQIFNYDLELEEKLKIKELIDYFLPMQKYSLVKNGRVIDINSKIDLKNIWK